MSKKKGSGAPQSNTAELDALGALDGPTTEVYESLRIKLVSAKTLAELTAAVDDDFRTDVVRLPEPVQRILRDVFAIQRDEVKHRVKMEALEGKVVIVTDPPEFPPSTLRKPDGSLSVFCVIKGTIEDTGEKFECLSGAVRITRHFQDSRLTSYPQRLTFYQESRDAMRARNAQPDTNPMWLVKREAAPREKSDGIPF